MKKGTKIYDSLWSSNGIVTHYNAVTGEVEYKIPRKRGIYSTERSYCRIVN